MSDYNIELEQMAHVVGARLMRWGSERRVGCKACFRMHLKSILRELEGEPTCPPEEAEDTREKYVLLEPG